MPPDSPFLAPLTSNPGMRYDPYRQFTGFEGIPSAGMGQGLDNLIQMAVQMAGSPMMNQHGMLPLGLSNANIYDRLEKLRMQQAHDQLVARAFQQDIPGYTQTARGMASMVGTPWNAQTIQQAQGYAEAFANWGPALTQMLGPQLMDQLSGQRGSSGAMMEMMFQGSQFRLDPVTGQAGMSAGNIGLMQERVFEQLYGPGSAMRNTGLSAGMTGSVFSELARFGMLPGPTRLGDVNAGLLDTAVFDRIESLSGRNNRTATETRELERLRGATTDGGIDLGRLTPGDIDNLRQAPDVADALVTLDAGKITDTLESYSNVIQAMREIFGDAGRPNAPVPELINALNALSSGGLSQLQPVEMEQMVRTTYNLARNSGVGLEGLMVLTQAAEVQAQQYGLPPVMSNDLVRESLAFRSAFMHQGAGNLRAWGRGNVDEMTMMNQQLAAGGMDSPLFNRMGMLLRLEEGARQMGGQLRPGSTAAAMSEAFRAGLTEFVDPATGQTRSVIMGEDEFLKVVGEGTGLNQLQAQELLEDRFNNLRPMQGTAATGTLRRAQNEELRRIMQFEMTDSVRAGFAAAGIDGDQARLLAGEAAGVTMEAFGDARIYGDDTRRTGIVANRVRDRMKALAVGGGPGAAAAQQLLDKFGGDDTFWAGIAQQQYSEVQELAENNPFGIRTNAQNLLTLTDPRLAQEALREQAREGAKAQFQRALAPANRGSGLLRSFVSALQDAGPDTNLQELFLQSIGGTNEDEIRRILTGTDADRAQTGGVLQNIATARTGFATAREKYLAAMDGADPKAKTAAFQELQTQADALRQAMQQGVDFIGRKGFFTSDSISERDVINMQRDRTWVTQQLANQTATEGVFRTGVATERQNVDDLVSSVVEDERLLVRLGGGGIGRLDQMRDATRRLDELAVQHAGGSLANLLRGNLNEGIGGPERQRILNQALALRERQGELYEWFAPRVEGAIGFSFLNKRETERLQDITAKFAEDDKLKGRFLGTPMGLLSAADPEFQALKASAAWGNLSDADRDLILKSRQAYATEEDKVKDYRRDYRKNAFLTLSESLKSLTGDEMSDADIMGMVGGEAAMKKITTDMTPEGRRRIAGLGMMSRDIKKQRDLEKLEKQGKLTDAQKEELTNLRKRTAGYDAYWRELGSELDPDVARAPGADNFMQAFDKIPAVGGPVAKDDKSEKVEVTMKIDELYIDGQPQGEAEGNAMAWWGDFWEAAGNQLKGM